MDFGPCKGNNIVDESASIAVQQSELEYPEPFLEEMRPLPLIYSNRQLNRAGKDISTWTKKDGDEKFDLAYPKVNQLRLAHSYPLRAVTAILRRKSLAVDPAATVYSRSKRVISIMRKLRRIPTMKLTTMQDVGGCRAVVKDINAVLQLKLQFKELGAKLNGCEEFDYILAPKPDGYRSFHFVVRFKSNNSAYADIPGRRIEIQIRSRLQHQWATALETIDLFTEQTLKTGGGSQLWRRFFLLAADLFAIMEESPRLPGSILDARALETDLLRLWEWLGIEEMMTKWGTLVLSQIPINPGDNYNYLIETDIENRTTSVRAFPPEQALDAYEAYGMAEVANMLSTSRSAVLVSTYALSGLREAFLSYYGDTFAFVSTIKHALGIDK